MTTSSPDPADDGRRAPWLTPRAGEDDLAPQPQPVPRSAWVLPHASEADEDGVVGIGADLEPSTLVEAYRNGIFPWPHQGVALPWFSPDPRGVVRPDTLHVSRSLRHTLRRSGWVTTVDRDFESVVARCATARGPDGTWITRTMARAYGRLHELGWAHAIEVWDGHELAGGLYGVQVGGVFTGESMFHRVPDASKVAMVDLCARLAEAGGRFLDVQLTTPHLRSMGAIDMPRSDYLHELVSARDQDVRLPRGPRPVRRLTEA